MRAWHLPRPLHVALGLPPAVLAELARSGDPLLFLPLQELPKRSSAALKALKDHASARVVLRAPLPLIAAGVAAVAVTTEPTVRAVEPERDAAPPTRPCRTLPGVVLVGARAALRGSFPLRGSYFQVSHLCESSTLSFCGSPADAAAIAATIATCPLVSAACFFFAAQN